MSEKRQFRPVIRTQQDLEDAWRRLMGPWGFGGRSVWLMVIGPDDRPVPHLTEITDAGDPPDEGVLDHLAGFLGDLAESVGAPLRFAFLSSRPGPAGIGPHDRAWARLAYDAARRGGVACEVVHLATPGEVVPIPMDEVLADSA